MRKVIGFVFGFLLFVSLFSVVIAVENDVDVKEGSCEDECNTFWMSAMPACPGEQDTTGIYPDCECGWKCDDEFEDEKEDVFGEDDDYRCEDMNENDCGVAEGCESILGSSFCEGDVCTDDMVWKGCRYEGDDFFEEYEDVELEQKAGRKPGDTFYFIDKFFDRFGDDIKVKEERIAEIKQLVEEGDIEGAKVALKDYVKLADELEREIDPDRREEAKRSAAAIRAAMKDIRDMLPPGERGKFVSDIMSREHKIATAAEIAGKIKDLCVQLAELDPLEYSKMCRTDGDAPRWQRELDRDLSAEQEKIAKDFVKIMKQCFKTSGEDCACEDIPFYDFSVACSKAAPLATACDVDGDEVACDDLDNLDMPELPDWLQPIWDDLEDGMMEAQFDMHMPKECVEAGITDPKECGKVMIKEHSPIECRAALLDSGCDSERECRGICDEIMMKEFAPECVEKGITDPEDCRDFYEGEDGPGRRRGRGKRRGGDDFGPDCSEVEDSTERLNCYDNRGNEMGEHYGTDDRFEDGEGEITWQCKENRIHWGPDCEIFMREEWPGQERMRMEEGDMRREQEGDWREKEKECAASCDLQNGWWDFSGGECVCKTDERSSEPRYRPEDDYQGGPGCNDCSSQCPAGANTDCVNGRCVCLDVPDSGPQYGEGEGPGEPGDFDDNGEAPTVDSGTTSVDSGSDSVDSGSDSVEDGGSDDAPEGGNVVTGEVFLDYFG